MTSYGNRYGTVGKLIYDEGGSNSILGIADRNDKQVIWFEYDNESYLTAVTDSDGRRVAYEYTDGRLTRVVDVLNNETLYEYNDNGWLTKSTDAAGRPTIIAYDDYGDITQVTDRQGNGHFFEFNFDEAKNEYYAKILSSSGREKEVWYDSNGDTNQVAINGRITKQIVKDGDDLIVIDEKKNTTRKQYDEWDNLTKIIYPDETWVVFEFDHKYNQPTRIVDQRGYIIDNKYNELGNLVQKTEAVGTESERITTFAYNEFGQPLSITTAEDAETQRAITALSYDENGNLQTILDPEGGITEFLSYDIMGNLLEMKDARDHKWTFGYDNKGRKVSDADPLGNTISYEFDGANNRTAVINALLKRFDYEYDDHNNMIKTVDPHGKVVAQEYNTDDLPTRKIDEEGKISEVVYDNEGRTIELIDGSGNRIQHFYSEIADVSALSSLPVKIAYPTFERELYYDTMQRLIREVDVLDGTISYERSYLYDEVGNLKTETDAEGNKNHYEYDALNRLVKTTDALGNVTERSYDDRDNMIALKDSNGGVTNYEYDRNNRLTKMMRPMGEETVYGYDEAGNLISVIDAKRQKTVHEYDEANRPVTTRHFTADDHITPLKTVQFEYDELGNRVSYDDGTTSAVYAYDDLQRKTSETVNYGSFTLGYFYTYFANGLKKSFTGHDGVEIGYSYDSGNRQQSIKIPGQGGVDYNSYQWLKPTKISMPGGSTKEYTYDPLMQLKTIMVRDPGTTPIMYRHYTYSPAGNITLKALIKQIEKIFV